VNQEKANKLRKTIELAQQQLEELMNPKFTYPMWFKKEGNVIVKFTGLTSGEDTFGNHRAGYIPHTNTTIWTQVDEPIKQWEPQDGEWYINSDGFEHNCPTDQESRLFNIGYKTREQAKWASKQIRSFNRLLSYVSEFDEGWGADWNNSNQAKCYILYNHTQKSWISVETNVRQSVQVYMSEQCAKKLVAQLNSGAVVL